MQCPGILSLNHLDIVYILVIIKVGDDAEVLYFVTKSKLEMEEWIHAFREGISIWTTKLVVVTLCYHFFVPT